MGYKLLGYVVWQGGKWYLRRRMPGLAQKAAIGGLAVVLIGAGVVAVQRQQSSN